MKGFCSTSLSGWPEAPMFSGTDCSFDVEMRSSGKTYPLFLLSQVNCYPQTIGNCMAIVNQVEWNISFFGHFLRSVSLFFDHWGEVILTDRYISSVPLVVYILKNCQKKSPRTSARAISAAKGNA
jgi:hypothetical protein